MGGWRQLEAPLAALEGPSGNRVEGLEAIKDAISLNSSLPPEPLLSRVVDVVCACACDPNSRVANKWLLFLNDLASQHGCDLSPHFGQVLAVCIQSLQCSSGSVRQAAVQVLCSCSKVKEESPRVLLQGLADGIQDDNEVTRAECCAALVTVYSSAVYKNASMEAMMLHEIVVPSLVEGVGDRSSAVSKTAANSLESLSRRTPDAFQATIQQLPPDKQALVASNLSGFKAIRRSQSGNSSASALSEAEESGDLEFGFVPHRLMTELQDANNWRVRALAIEELQGLVKEIDPRAQAVGQEQWGALVKFLMTLLCDPNFKIEITALQILGDVIGILGGSARGHVDLMLPYLMDKMGDNKTLVRQAGSKVMLKLVSVLGPQGLTSTLLGGLTHENWRIREEILLLTMQIVLTFPAKDINLEVMVRSTQGCLYDGKPKVKFTAIEALALLYSKFGEKVNGLLNDLDERTRRMIDVRFSQPQVAQLSADGVLELPALPRGMAGDGSEGFSSISIPTAPQEDVVSPLSGRRAKQPGSARFSPLKGSMDPSIPWGEDLSQSPEPRVAHGEGPTDNFGISDAPLYVEHPAPEPSGRRHSSTLTLQNGNSRGRQPDKDWLGNGGTPRSQGADGNGAQGHGPGPIKPFWMGDMKASAGGHQGGQPGEMADPSVGGGGGPKRTRPPSAGRRAGGREQGAWRDLENGNFTSLGGLQEGSAATFSPPMSPSSRMVSPPQSPMSPYKGSGGAYSPVGIRLQHSASQPLPASTPGMRDSSSGDTTASNVDTVSRQNSEDLSLSHDDITSRLNILKTRRGRTGSGRRVVSAPLREMNNEMEGLGDTTPSHHTVSNPVFDINDTEEPETRYQTAPASKGQRGSHSAPSAPAAGPQLDGLPGGPGGGKGGGPRSVVDLNARPIEHTPTEELRPLDQPEVEMRTLVDTLLSSDWAVQMEALNKMRALSIYHATTTVLPQLHSVILAALQVVDNLRSQLSKAAIMALSDMFRYLKQHMDPELDKVVMMLVKKACETSGFIADEAKNTMQAAIDNCTESRVMSALLHANASKNNSLRAKVATFLGALVENMGPRLSQTRDLDRVFPVLVKFLSEGLAEPRQAGRRALLSIHEHSQASGEFDRLLRRCQDADIKVVEKVLAQEKAAHSAFTVTSSSNQRPPLSATVRSSTRPPLLSSTSRTPASTNKLSSTSSDLGHFDDSLARPNRRDSSKQISMNSSGPDLSIGGSEVTKPKRRMSSRGLGSQAEEPALEKLGTISSGIASSDFRCRHEAVNELAELMMQEKEACSPRTPQLVDMFVGRMGDNNQKVAVAALQGMEKVVSSYGDSLEPSVGLLVPALAANLANTSLQIRTLASQILETLPSAVDPVSLVQPLSSAVDFGNQRAKASLLDSMRGLVREVGEKKPQLLHKCFLPSAIKLLDEHKSDIRVANTALIKELHRVLGEQIFNPPRARLPDRSASKLREALEA